MLSEIRIGDTAPEFWDELLRVERQHKIRYIGGVTYPLIGHGVPSQNLPTPPFVSEVLPDSLRHLQVKQWLTYREDEALALGSLVYTWPWKERRGPGFVPMAFVVCDLDCPKSDENLQKIISVLQFDFKHCPWTIIDSGHSYHLVFDGLVEPGEIPWHYGGLIKSFSVTEPENNRVFFEELGNALQEFRENPEKIKEICAEIFKKISHYEDSPDKGIPYIIDLRWMAHSLLELLNYLEKHDGSFGFLRIRGVPSPVVVARNECLG